MPIMISLLNKVGLYNVIIASNLKVNCSASLLNKLDSNEEVDSIDSISSIKTPKKSNSRLSRALNLESDGIDVNEFHSPEKSKRQNDQSDQISIQVPDAPKPHPASLLSARPRQLNFDKTILCKSVERNRPCLNGGDGKCRFSHSIDELVRAQEEDGEHLLVSGHNVNYKVPHNGELDSDKKTKVFEKTNMCKFFLVGNGSSLYGRYGKCKRGAKCTFAHGIQDLKEHKNLKKTALCDLYMKLGRCRFGDDCKYAHGKEQLVNGPNLDYGSTIDSKTFNCMIDGQGKNLNQSSTESGPFQNVEVVNTPECQLPGPVNQCPPESVNAGQTDETMSPSKTPRSSDSSKSLALTSASEIMTTSESARPASTSSDSSKPMLNLTCTKIKIADLIESSEKELSDISKTPELPRTVLKLDEVVKANSSMNVPNSAPVLKLEDLVESNVSNDIMSTFRCPTVITVGQDFHYDYQIVQCVPFYFNDNQSDNFNLNEVTVPQINVVPGNPGSLYKLGEMGPNSTGYDASNYISDASLPISPSDLFFGDTSRRNDVD